MSNQMSDREFILYCRTHCSTPRAAFVPQQLARLHLIAGNIERANSWNLVPNQILDGYKFVVLDLIDQIEGRRGIK